VILISSTLIIIIIGFYEHRALLLHNLVMIKSLQPPLACLLDFKLFFQ
jgi:hypothetical protein